MDIQLAGARWAFIKGGWQNKHLGMEAWVKDGQETQRGLLVNHLTDYAISSWWIILKSMEGPLRCSL